MNPPPTSFVDSNALHLFSDDPTPLPPPIGFLINERWKKASSSPHAPGDENQSASTNIGDSIRNEYASTNILAIASDLFGPSWPDEPIPDVVPVHARD